MEKSPQAGAVIVTLRTPDGFRVSFTLAALEVQRMATRDVSTSVEASGIIGS